ncbi:hypothetical protein C8J56DRAFT_948402 [Mycena floridula]|nr:hypothetical protein C8J56DRAFT_948402 [Mycena floridula]
MEAYSAANPAIWDLSQASSFSQLPDEDFLALLQKQFPTEPFNGFYGANFNDGGFAGAINPQNLNLTQPSPLPAVTPPSEDSSPSPTNNNQDDEAEYSQLKRKASDDDFEAGPSTKNQHTGPKKSTTKRKSSGGSANPEDSRLLKRKEQNRAAQRAFRERKEKHVKDLEDKVADLEAKNTEAISENENLKDLLSRLQNENMTLKQSSFTFSVPKTAQTFTPALSPSSSSTAKSPDSRSPQSIFSSPLIPFSASSSPGSFKMPTNPLDLSSLTSFDPNMLNLLDEPTATSTGDSMAMDYGYGNNSSSGSSGFLGNFTTIASNPVFTSLASYFDEPISAGPNPDLDFSAMARFSNPTMMNFSSPTMTTISPTMGSSMGGSPPAPSTGSFDYSDFGNLSSWSPAPPTQDSFDDILNFLDQPSFTTPAISPIIHSEPMDISSGASSSSVNLSKSLSNKNRDGFSPESSSSSSSAGASPASDMTSATSVSEGGKSSSGDDCPKTKAEFAARIGLEGGSVFAPASLAGNNVMANLISSRQAMNKVLSCESNSSTFPRTDKNENNIEVLSAWRAITSNPNFKDADINELCSEFSSKARCDGSKVVLEPQGVSHILESLSKHQQH